MLVPAERRLDDPAAGVFDTEPSHEELEALVDGQRRRGQHTGVQRFEQFVPQRVGDVDGLGRQRNRGATAQFHPVHERRVVALEDLLQRFTHLLDTARNGIDGLAALLYPFGLPDHVVEGLAQHGPLDLQIDAAAFGRGERRPPRVRTQTLA